MLSAAGWRFDFAEKEVELNVNTGDVALFAVT